jgi:hypothetical protein
MNCADRRCECAGRGKYFARLYGSASSMATSYSPLFSYGLPMPAGLWFVPIFETGFVICQRSQSTQVRSDAICGD